MSTLWIIGTPLQENAKAPLPTLEKIAACSIVIGESRRFLNRLPLRDDQEVFFLDNITPKEWTALSQKLGNQASREIEVALLSDCGMPILFDPGKEVLERCKELGYQIRSLPAATSWGTACALSGFELPFFVYGFLPQESEKRVQELKKLKTVQWAVVLMDTPYRFRKLLDECILVLGKRRIVFLGWELASESETLFWGSLGDLQNFSEKKTLTKGEFVLILNKD